MYERHFGLSGAPFRLSPDPELPFLSDNHREALAAMRHIFALQPPLLVVSGEMGSGKTTLLRQWIDECADRGVVVAHIANTQLDADELLQSVAIHVGAAGAQDTPGDVAESLRRQFLRIQGRRVLLAIDEAQNLVSEALRVLVDLAETARQARVELRVCLAGHPELRAQVASAHGLQPSVQRMCHLGALGPGQTQGYIEHRLMRVGWVGVPSFDVAAFEEIHRFTGGVPRRVNMLVNRLLLSQMLSGATRVDAPCVVTVARALRAETAQDETDPARVKAPQLPSPRAAGDAGCVLLVASGRSDHVKAVPLLHAIAGRTDLPSPLLVSAGGRAAWQRDRALHEFVGLGAVRPIELGAGPEPALDAIAARFEELLEQHRPRAVIVFDGNPVSQCCALICHERDVPLVHIGSDPQGLDEATDGGSPRASIARVA
ncbi:MAG: AAA family ATPase, partial [Solirubrobacteraceae bacterium]|nr:AAA family ATPase [Solirubrobacteraceae bacterium]